MHAVRYACSNVTLVTGDFIHLRVLGQSVVVLGSSDVIFECLDARSTNTSENYQERCTVEGGAESYEIIEDADGKSAVVLTDVSNLEKPGDVETFDNNAHPIAQVCKVPLGA